MSPACPLAAPENVSSTDLARTILHDKEWAIIDVQEQGKFVEGHLFHASNVPYSRLETRITSLLPRRDVRVILVDACDEGVARLAASRLQQLGYSRVAVLKGGNAGWVGAGNTLFQGVHVPSKAFGEHVEEAYQTPSIDADELAVKMRRQENFILLDGRPEHEHALYTLPGSSCCPNGELALRVASLVPSDEAVIVVHCAGRTRSILGAETLRRLGLPNKVVALRNGTQGWLLSGRSLIRGQVAAALPCVPVHRREAHRALGERLRQQYAVPAISNSDLQRVRAASDRTVHVLDVRTQPEYAQATVRGAMHAPGGQLIQATDLWVATAGALVVVFDDDGLRAVMVAAWLREMGFDAVVLGDPVLQSHAHGIRPVSQVNMPRIRAADTGGWRIFDIRSSSRYRLGHHPGAIWLVRHRVAQQVRADDQVAFVCDEPELAELAAMDAIDAGARAVAVLEDARTSEITPDCPPDQERVDHEFFTAGRNDGVLEAAVQYLKWETNLLKQMGPIEWSRFDPAIRPH